MQIIIPMTGYGSRFVAAGYKDLKPFIKVQGRPIIEWIVKGMYSDNEEFIFVCRKEHIENIDGMQEYLLSLATNSKIYAIDNWEKKGPAYDVLKASEIIDNNKPSIINYCDFYMIFHPNLLPEKNLYASCLTDGDDNLVEIREKYSFEQDKMKAKHSPGVYYFSNGSILKKYCQKLVDSNKTINGEFYASLPYNFMVDDKLKVWVPTNVEYFCQWGTPEDMKEYLFWTEICRRFNK